MCRFSSCSGWAESLGQGRRLLGSWEMADGGVAHKGHADSMRAGGSGDPPVSGPRERLQLARPRCSAWSRRPGPAACGHGAARPGPPRRSCVPPDKIQERRASFVVRRFTWKREPLGHISAVALIGRERSNVDHGRAHELRRTGRADGLADGPVRGSDLVLNGPSIGVVGARFPTPRALSLREGSAGRPCRPPGYPRPPGPRTTRASGGTARGSPGRARRVSVP